MLTGHVNLKETNCLFGIIFLNVFEGNENLIGWAGLRLALISFLRS